MFVAAYKYVEGIQRVAQLIDAAYQKYLEENSPNKSAEQSALSSPIEIVKSKKGMQ